MKNINQLREIAKTLRIDVLESVYAAKSGHIGGSFSAADILAVLYFYKMRIDPHNPDMDDRDRFVLSKGHAAPVLYSALAHRGFFDLSELGLLRNIKSHLQGAPCTKTPGVDMSAGPLGQGISAAVGMALGGRYLKKKYKTYCMLGDGEIQEGQVWEALMSAAAFSLGNLVLILDHNKVQMCGTVDEIMPIGDPCKKIEAFGWKVKRINGHDISSIINAFDSIDDDPFAAPTAIIADTIKGKGVSFMEGLSKWHGAVPNENEYKIALQELRGEWDESKPL